MRYHRVVLSSSCARHARNGALEQSQRGRTHVGQGADRGERTWVARLQPGSAYVVVPLCLARAALASVQSLLLGNACLLVLWVALAATEHDYYGSYVHTLCVHLIPPVMTLSVLLAGVFFALPSIPRALHDLGTLLLGRPSYAFAPYVVLCLRRRAAVWRARPSQASRPVVIAFSPSSGWSSVPADSVPSRARARTRTRTREPAHAANAWQDEGHER